jgi:archaemetzincin
MGAGAAPGSGAARFFLTALKGERIVKGKGARTAVILLIPIGEIDRAVLESLRHSISEVFHEQTDAAGAIPLPAESWNRRREQYDADIVLGGIPLPAEGMRVLAVAGVDLFSHGVNFVFGAADALKRRAVISLFRLRQEIYYLPHDDALLKKRALTEAVHELGHTYGLGHCASQSCVMHFSNNLAETDTKGWKLCRDCRENLEKGSEAR